jgi:TetR/AcrR family transcriptional regulator
VGITERKERERGYRREEILNAAQTVFFKKGLAEATMDEIAETAELSKGTLYLYCKCKEDLYLGVMMRGIQILYDRLAAVISENEPVPQVLVRLAQEFFDFFTTHRHYFRMLHFLETRQLHKEATEEMQQSCRALNQKTWDMVVELLRHGIRDGSVRADLNPAEVLVILWSSATALLLRIDSEDDFWRDRFHIDLKQTLNLSNNLLFGAVLTEQGRRQLAEMPAL